MNQSSGGYELVLGPVLLSLLGLLIDRWLGTIPWFTIGLCVAGFVGSVANVYYRYNRDMERIEAETAELRRRTTHTSDASETTDTTDASETSETTDTPDASETDGPST